MSYWQLSSVYFFYFAVLGATNPYWGLFLQDEGFDAQDIGSLMAIFIATKLIAPNIWGYLADKTGRHLKVMQLGAALTPLFFIGVYWQQGFWSMAAVMLAYSFFWNAILPQYEVITLRAIKGREDSYSKIRLWGSVGFIVAVAGLGWVLDFLSVQILPTAILFIMLGMGLSTYYLTEIKRNCLSEKKIKNDKFLKYLFRAPVICFLFAVILMQLSHAPYYTFYSIFLEEYGYTRTSIGLLWSLGVLAEIILFWQMHRLLKIFNATTILWFSLFVAAVRWFFMGASPESLWVILLLQVLHAATFGSFHAASIAIVRQMFPDRHAGQGQAVYSSIGFGVGGALGAWLSGWMWQNWGAELSFYFAALAAFAGAVVILVSLQVSRGAWLASYD
ncbi:MFS transporter, PPP family, 3-phenylpropionic acid transporter [Oceanospirillum multiglobuliferum]|uniref:Major facilitator superfamily (MFS) profile domain-containing protein n=1 Tax=Oceanospirillum multiglobuliferum TaxID=64969 RepID=A0A1T4N2G0_9GAMM|nr:MFS transporter [Oceanospirillum multiglobuliferum]OPX55803.1 hypothetical protein BTE48_06250 [Oceanospirillum multiglobuliferum]SJZ73058.1 MFS transporter, PPP family, 3-phenylpropionic acid transporter [Oceanospirillum multiglobuliferum]